MTESSQVGKTARKWLHAPPAFLYLRVENSVSKGWPDAQYLLLGVAGLVEHKLLPKSGGVPKHFTLEQLQFGMTWSAAGGLWHLLGLRGTEWRLYDVASARAFFHGTADEPVVAVDGSFPTGAILEHLAPRDLRRV